MSELPGSKLMPDAQDELAPVHEQTPVGPSQPQLQPHPHDACLGDGTELEAIGAQHEELLEECEEEPPEEEPPEEEPLLEELEELLLEELDEPPPPPPDEPLELENPVLMAAPSRERSRDARKSPATRKAHPTTKGGRCNNLRGIFQASKTAREAGQSLPTRNALVTVSRCRITCPIATGSKPWPF
jgi:hypothetical protein